LLGRRILDCPEIKVEERFLFVALILVLFAQAEDFLEDFDVEAFAFGFGKNLLLPLVQRFEFFLDMLNALDERQYAITRNSNRIVHAAFLLDGRKARSPKVVERLTPRFQSPTIFLLARDEGHLAAPPELARDIRSWESSFWQASPLAPLAGPSSSIAE
jgi:hypothetical protein